MPSDEQPKGIPGQIAGILAAWIENTFSVFFEPKKTFTYHAEAPRLQRVDPKILVLGLMTIILANSIYGINIPESKISITSVSSYFPFLLIAWTVFIAIYYLWARLIGGTSNFYEAIDAGIKVKSATYLLSAFLSIAFVAIFGEPDIFSSVGQENNYSQRVNDIFINLHSTIDAIYLTIAFSFLNRFGLMRAIVFSIAPIFLVLVEIVLYIMSQLGFIPGLVGPNLKWGS